MAEPSSTISELRRLAANSLAAVSPVPAASQASQLAGEMAARWRRGERPLAEEYLAEHAALLDTPPAAIKLICEEICLRQEHGEEVDSVQVIARFPQWRDELEVLLGCHRLLEPVVSGPRFPDIGEVLHGFELIGELGRGAQGRVFLATQPELADRPVVLKLTAVAGQEHLSLARLQHTHIVPLYLAHDDRQRNLRLLCMPYFGGLALSAVLDALKTKSTAQRTGADLLRALDAVPGNVALTSLATAPARQFFVRATYVQTVCWLGACLADALHYAHERGLVHLDMKPGNVLLTADAQPMLLDFHLARAPLRTDGAPPDWFGGTTNYMSPEQQAAFDAVRAERPIPQAVDGRSDVYSLGLVLHECLAKTLPRPETPPRLDRVNPHVSRGLADIIGRCLQHDPGLRYPDAASLAADLRRHLTDQPLRGVANRNLTERWRKWRRRRPHALPLVGTLMLLLAVTVGANLSWRNQQQQRVREIETALIQGRELLAKNDYAAARAALERGRQLSQELQRGDWSSALDAELRQVQEAQLLHDLHGLADQVRFLHDPDTLSAERAAALEARCRALWDERDLLLRQTQASPSTERGRQLRADLLDLALLGTELRMRLAAPAEQAARRQEALQTFDEAEALFGPSPVLHRQRRAVALGLGRTDLARAAETQAEQSPPRTAWEHYALGRALLREGQLAEAEVQLARAVSLEPGAFWPNFSQGICAYRRGQHQEAVNAFRVCIALAPERAECYFNRALAHQSLGQAEHALADYERALRLQPSLAAAAFNRGVLLCREQRHREALADFQQALRNGFAPAPVYYNLAVAHHGLHDRSAAAAHAQQALRHQPGHPGAQELLQQLRGK
ncbi:MAG: tetratricopeptide repeat protein [Planctomycetia bacterium]|nr:tetratricopeptide repeat protein [Planctomycetia bacterium]